MTSSFLESWLEQLPSFRSTRRYSWALLAPAVALSLSVLTNSVASRVLGPAGFGAFAVAVSVLTLLGVTIGFGMPVSLVRFSSMSGTERSDSMLTYHAVAW